MERGGARASLRWYWQRALAQLSEGAWLVGGMGAEAHLRRQRAPGHLPGSAGRSGPSPE